MCEEWRVIEGFPEYQVSNLGRVKSLKNKEQLLKPAMRKVYPSVDLYNDGKYSRVSIHRLVALAFVPNPENKLEVDHINRITTDNRLENLRWATRSDQMKNRDDYFRGTNTGEPYISWRKDGGTFVVHKTINGILHRKTCHTLEEAIAYRDVILNPLPASS